MSGRRLIAVTLVSFLLAAGSAPSAGADTETGSVAAYAEGWHYETVTPLLAEACEVTESAAPEIPVAGTNPCSLLPSSSGLGGPASIFAEDTLHVARLNGVSVAATYLQLDMFTKQGKRILPEGATLTGGELTLPVAPTELSVQQSAIVMDAARHPSTAPYTVLGLIYLVAGLAGVPVPPLPVPVPQLPVPDLPLPETAGAPVGYVGVDRAQLVVCPIKADFFVTSEASLDEPPELDCGAGRGVATYHDDGIQPKFVADLDGLVDAWGDSDPALAIIPAPATTAGNDSWIVSFWGRDNETPGAQPIHANLTYETKDAGTGRIGTGSEPDTDGAATSHITSLTGPEPSAVDADSTHALPPAPQDGPAISDAVPDDPPLAAPLLQTFGYAYRIAWLFPLLLLIGLAFTGHSLTRQLCARHV